MKILLVNNNQVVQKLIDVTTKKVDCELTTLISFREFERENDVKKYDLVVFDQEILEEYKGDFSFLSGLKSIVLYSQAMQDSALLSHFTYTIKKPFLPNEFLSFLVSTKQSLKEKQKEEFANLDEKEMFANIDAEEDRGEEDDDLNKLLEDLSISTDDFSSPGEKHDDLEALLQTLPEEEHLEESEENASEKSQAGKKQEQIQEENLEDEFGLENPKELQEQEEELEALGKIQESNLDPQKEDLIEDDALQTQVSNDGDALDMYEGEDDGLDKIVAQNKTKGEYVGGALDLAEIAKVQSLLDEVQKSGAKIDKPSSGELDLLQNLLSSRSPEGIREILNGMQLTINISFPKKDHQ